MTGSKFKKQVEQSVYCITNAYRPILNDSSPSLSSEESDESEDLVTELPTDEISDQVRSLQISLGRSLKTWPKPVLLNYAKTIGLRTRPNMNVSTLIRLITGYNEPASSSHPSSSSQAPNSSTKGGQRKGHKVSRELETFVMTTSHTVIQIGDQTISNMQLLEMNATQARELFKVARPRSAIPKKREDIIQQLWDIDSHQNNYILAEQMKPSEKLRIKNGPSDKLQDLLPFIHLYRAHFASIDKLDQFLSYLECEISTKSAEVRLAERIFMCALSNAHTWFCEDHARRNPNKPPSELRPAKAWGKAIVKYFLELADDYSRKNQKEL